jgi:hypothetical protein
MARKDFLTRLADAGEDAITKLGESPGVDRMFGFATSTRDRLDELTKRVRGIDELERRIEKLEKRLDEMSGTKSGSSSRSRAKSGSTQKAASQAKASTGAKGSSGAKSSTSSKDSSAKTGGDSPG